MSKTEYIEYFKNQSKKFYSDWESHTKRKAKDGSIRFVYHSKYYDIKSFFKLFGFNTKDEENFTLMRAQHLLFQLLTFNNWEALINAEEEELKLAKEILKNCPNAKAISNCWDYYNYADLENYSRVTALKILEALFSEQEYVELTKEEQEKAIIEQTDNFKHFGKKSKVHCIHCECDFLFEESKVQFSIVMGMPAICCKYSPECSGTIIDFFNTDN